MDLNRQAETIMNLMAADYDAGGAVFRNFCVGQDSYLHTAWLWDGILLWANDIHLTRLSYPVTLFDEDAYLLLNICHSGRCEVELSPGSFVYMSPGILNVSMNPPKSKYYYPGGIYKGIELCFDLRKMREQMPEALTSYGFDLSMLERFAGKGNVLAMMKSESVQEEEKLFDMLCEGKSSIYSIRFAILSLLHHLVNGGAEEFDSRTLVTKGQRRIVTEAEQMMTENFGKRYTIEEMAARFGISASALKKYFSAVYGKPVSQYMREKRMERAMELLVNTEKSIGEVALACGYEHQGKFGTAFKEFTGISPLEYRRQNRKSSGYTLMGFDQQVN